MRAWTNTIRELARKICDLGEAVQDDELIVILTKNPPASHQPPIVSFEPGGGKQARCRLRYQLPCQQEGPTEEGR